MDAKCIVIIDDDADDREFFCDAIRDVDPEVHCITCSSGFEALHLFHSQDLQPDNIFLDLNMPKMNGKQCLAEIKRIEKYKNVPVIIYSTSKAPADMREVKRLGARHFITKPSKFCDLRMAIALVLNSEWAKVEELK